MLVMCGLCFFESSQGMTRPEEIIRQYHEVLRQHLEDLRSGKADSTFEIQDIAALLHIHPTHLSNTIQEQLGKSPCDIYEQMLLGIAKELILASDQSISAIARHLTFDPSNFTKFFKRFEGMTPKQWRDQTTLKI
jgi:AraC-like DNA-binding protein